MVSETISSKFPPHPAESREELSILKSSFNSLLAEFGEKWLIVFFYTDGVGLLNFLLESKNLVFTLFVFELLNRISPSFETDGVKIKGEISLNVFGLIEWLEKREINNKNGWNRVVEHVDIILRILFPFQNIVFKCATDGSKVSLKKYIDMSRYVFTTAQFDEQRGIFDESPLKDAVLSIANNKGGLRYSRNLREIAIIIFYFNRYYGEINILNNVVDPMVLWAMTKVHHKLSLDSGFKYYYEQIGDINKLLVALGNSTFSKTQMKIDDWEAESKRLVDKYEKDQAWRNVF